MALKTNLEKCFALKHFKTKDFMNPNCSGVPLAVKRRSLMHPNLSLH